MSPVESYKCVMFWSMQNIQWLTQYGGITKYVAKYIDKIDDQNYIWCIHRRSQKWDTRYKGYPPSQYESNDVKSQQG